MVTSSVLGPDATAGPYEEMTEEAKAFPTGVSSEGLLGYRPLLGFAWAAAARTDARGTRRGDCGLPSRVGLRGETPYRASEGQGLRDGVTFWDYEKRSVSFRH
jgi:hypothetical protein